MSPKSQNMDSCGSGTTSLWQSIKRDMLAIHNKAKDCLGSSPRFDCGIFNTEPELRGGKIQSEKPFQEQNNKNKPFASSINANGSVGPTASIIWRIWLAGLTTCGDGVGEWERAAHGHHPLPRPEGGGGAQPHDGQVAALYPAILYWGWRLTAIVQNYKLVQQRKLSWYSTAVQTVRNTLYFILQQKVETKSIGSILYLFSTGRKIKNSTRRQFKLPQKNQLSYAFTLM